MYGILATPDHIESIKEAIGEGDIWYEKVDQLGEDAFIQECISASQVNLLTLIVDMDMTDPESLIKGIRKFRVSRGNTRIVILAVGREPGDKTINTLLKFQIFDFIAPSLNSIEGYEDEDFDELEDETEEDAIEKKIEIRRPLSHYIHSQLSLRPSYSNAARWDIETEAMLNRGTGGKVKTGEARGRDDKEKKPTSEKSQPLDSSVIEHIDQLEIQPIPTREKQTLVETIIGTVTIAVMGIEASSGSTHTAILIANYLERKGNKVALIEANSSNDFAKIANAYDGVMGLQNDEQYFTIQEVDYYKSNYRYDVAELLELEYDYIILDLGSHNSTKYMEEFYRSHVQVVTGHGSEWRQEKIYEFAQLHSHRDQERWIFCLPFSDKQTRVDVEKRLGEGIVTILPTHPDPYRNQRETDAVLESFLKEYMGQKRQKTRMSTFYLAIGLLSTIVIMLIIALYLK